MDNKISVIITEEASEFSKEELLNLEHMNMWVDFCQKDGDELIRRILADTPDVVIMDSLMTHTDSMGVLKAISKNQNIKQPLFVVFSSFHSSLIEREIMSAGASYYVLKPFKLSDLAENIQRIIKINKDKNAILSGGDNGIEVRVTEILHQIGVPAHIKGYHYLRDSIIISVEKPDIINAVTKQLYPTVAKKYETTSSRVERAIRHAIEVAWDRGDVDVLNSYFGYTIHNGRGKPTNSEFIAMISDKLRLQLKHAS